MLGTELGSSARACSLNYSANLSRASLRFFSLLCYWVIWFAVVVCVYVLLSDFAVKEAWDSQNEFGKIPIFKGVCLFLGVLSLFTGKHYVLGLQMPGLSNLYYVLIWESQIPTIPVQILFLISHFVSSYVNTLPPLNLNNGVKLCLSICFVTTSHFASLLILLRTLSRACILVILVRGYTGFHRESKAA